MNQEEWNEVARELKFSSTKAMLVHWYYTTGLRLQHIIERLGVSRKQVTDKFHELGLPLREEDKFN